jgi:DNA-binding response OmpR family regulator
LLLVEPQNTLADRIQRMLEQDKYSVTTYQNEEKVFTSFSEHSFDFVILYETPLNHSCNTTVKFIRSVDSHCKILLIIQNSIFDLLDTLWLGIDDYLNISELQELPVRLSLLKRRIAPITIESKFQHNDFVFDDRLSLLIYKGQHIVLTKTERKILYELFKSENTLTPQFLIQRVWQDFMMMDQNRLNFHLSVLRKKIRSITVTRLIKTVKGRGYRLA